MPLGFDELLEQRLNEQIESQEKYILDGSLVEFSDYKEACGILHGYRWALAELKTLISSSEGVI